MTATAAPFKDYREALRAGFAQEKSTGPAWLAALRQKAFAKFQELDFPTRRTESFKYMNLNAVVKTPFAAANGASLQAVPEKILFPHFSAHPEAHRAVLVNGRYCEKLSSIGKLRAGVVLGSLAASLGKEEARLRPLLDPHLEKETNPFAAINAFSFQDGLFLFVPADVHIEEPIHLVLATSGSPEGAAASYPRIVIALGERAKAKIVFHQIGFGDGRSLMNAVAEISLGREARLNVLQWQRETKESYRFFLNRARLSQASHLDFTAVSRGGTIIRNDFEIDFEEPDAYAMLRGLAVLSGFSQVFNHVVINHQVPRCTSRQIFKNILADKTQAEYSSLVHVWRDAQKSDTDQLDRNLLLSDDAIAYSRPQLKIDADDVKCTHGAATGQMEGSELFYLRSRGLGDKLARAILTFGFAEEIVQAIPLAGFRKSVADYLHAELSAMLEGRSS